MFRRKPARSVQAELAARLDPLAPVLLAGEQVHITETGRVRWAGVVSVDGRIVGNAWNYLTDQRVVSMDIKLRDAVLLLPLDYIAAVDREATEVRVSTVDRQEVIRAITYKVDPESAALGFAQALEQLWRLRATSWPQGDSAQ